MKIVVVEPHPDDAFLSCGWHLEKLWAEEERTIVTVYCDEKRGKEAANYATAIGASSVRLGLRESNLASTGPIGPIFALESMLGALNADLYVMPLGLQHPDHLRVRATPTPNVNGYSTTYYLDTPYQCKQKLQLELYGRILGKKLVSICYPPKRKWRHIPIFKSQSMFFHYNPMADFKIPEILVSNP